MGDKEEENSGRKEEQVRTRRGGYQRLAAQLATQQDRAYEGSKITEERKGKIPRGKGETGIIFLNAGYKQAKQRPGV